MPKLGMQPIRKRALVNAAIAEIGISGSCDVTVGQIARRAGVSSALAHHYFGSKEKIFLAAMRHVLDCYKNEVRAHLLDARSPYARVQAILEASFSPINFHRETISAWLHFWAFAHTIPEARRLLTIYQRRLHSNLLAGLRPLAGPRSEAIACGLGALIDGLYLREALRQGPPDGPAQVEILMNYLGTQLKEHSA